MKPNIINISLIEIPTKMKIFKVIKPFSFRFKQMLLSVIDAMHKITSPIVIPTSPIEAGK